MQDKRDVIHHCFSLISIPLESIKDYYVVEKFDNLYFSIQKNIRRDFTRTWLILVGLQCKIAECIKGAWGVLIGGVTMLNHDDVLPVTICIYRSNYSLCT